MAFTDNLAIKAKHAEKVVEKYLPSEDVNASGIEESMIYSVKAGGKRLRPIMLLEAFRLFCSNELYEECIAEPFMSAMEFIHTYSLVHDDLPAMDNDLLRRGKPTTHAKFGEATAILAGDGLLNLAFETMTGVYEKLESLIPEEAETLCLRALKAAKAIGEYAGIKGMIGGQVYDLNGEKLDRGQMSLKEKEDYISYTYQLKTSGLFSAALSAGAILGGADSESVNLIAEYGRLLGIAFQIEDDILDIIGDERLGKDIGSDEKNDKFTWTSIHTLEEARKVLNDYTVLCNEILDNIAKKDCCIDNISFFKGLTEYLTVREY